MKALQISLALCLFASCANTMSRKVATTRVYKEKSSEVISLEIQRGHQTRFQEFFIEGDVEIDRSHQFTRLNMISDKRAIVAKGQNKKLFIFHIDSQKLEPLNDNAVWTGPMGYIGLPVTYVIPQNTAKKTDLTIHFPHTEKPITFKDLFFPSRNTNVENLMERGDKFLVLHTFQGENKSRESWALDFSGNIVAESPHGIYSMQLMNKLHHRSLNPEFVAMMNPVTGKNFNGLQPVIPLDKTGRPVELPYGAHSAIIIPTDDGHSLGLIVLFPSPTSPGEYEGALHLGPFATIPKDIGSQPRIIDFKAYTHPNMPSNNYSVFTRSLSGEWVMAPESSYHYRQYFVATEINGDNKELAAVLAAKIKSDETQKRIKSVEEEKKFLASAAGQKFMREQKERMMAQKAHEDSMKTNPSYYCSRFSEATRLGREFVTNFVKNCPTTIEQLGAASVLGLDKKIIDTVRNNQIKQQDYNRQAENNRLQNTINAQRGTYDPQINVGAGAGGSAAQGTYGYQQQRAQWEKNLNRTLKRQQNP